MKAEVDYNERFTTYLRKRNDKEQAERQRSGKISPTKLTVPTLEAVLQMLGLPADPPSDQSLRYFIRGNTLEPIALSSVKSRWKASELQVECEYRQGIGYMDAFYNVPHEIKSAGSWTFKNAPLSHHKLQATWYALATGSEYAWLHYIEAEKYLIKSFKIDPQEHKAEVDHRIDLIESALSSGTLPDYTPLEPFHKSLKFSDYALFFNKKGVEAENILEQYYQPQYRLLKGIS